MTEPDFINYWNYFILIDKDLKNSSRFVEHCEQNNKVFSAEFARLILTACSEIDTICRLLCKEIDNTCQFDIDTVRNGKIDEYAKIILKKYPDIVTISIDCLLTGKQLCPWKEWAITPKYKSPNWWNDYNLVKHYRHSNYQKATLENAYYSLAGLLILLMYLRKTTLGHCMDANGDSPETMFSRYLMDMSKFKYNSELNTSLLGC